MNYIHGTHAEEQERLYFLNQLLNERCLQKITLTGDEQILDIGSGLGVFSRMLSRRLNTGSVVGIEKSTDQLDKARVLAREQGEVDLVDFREGSAYDLPLKAVEWGSFDLIFIRFVLEHLNHPLKALEQARQALKDGGRIILVDDDHANFRITPQLPSFDLLWTLYCKVYEQMGNDPYIGRHLVTLLHEAGFRNFKIDFILFGAAASEADFYHYANNLLSILQGAGPKIREIGNLDHRTFERYLDEIKSWSQRKDAVLWYTANWAEAVR